MARPRILRTVTNCSRLVTFIAAVGLLVALAGVTLVVRSGGAGGTGVEPCPALGQFEDVNFTVDRTAQIIDESSRLVEIALDGDYTKCKDSNLQVVLLRLRQRFAHGEALTCEQRRAYLDGRLAGPSGTPPVRDPSTIATVQAAFDRECSPEAFKANHWGISLEEALQP